MFAAGADGERPLLWRRSISEVAAQALPGTEDAQDPFWSPDSRWIGFFAEGKLKKTPAAGGAVQVVTSGIPDVRGGAWGPDDTILFVTGAQALQRVSAAGGQPFPASTLAQGEAAHRYPQFLPDGRHFLYQNSRPGDQTALYAGRTSADKSAISVSRTGAIAYADTLSQNGRLTWFDRGGRPVDSTGPEGHYTDFRLSPSEKSLAASLLDPKTGTIDVWITDFARGSNSRITSITNGGATLNAFSDLVAGWRAVCVPKQPRGRSQPVLPEERGRWRKRTVAAVVRDDARGWDSVGQSCKHRLVSRRTEYSLLRPGAFVRDGPLAAAAYWR